MNKRKRLLAWAGVFAVLMCVIYAYGSYMLINNVSGITTQLKEALIEMQIAETDVVSTLNKLCQDMIYFAAFNGVSGAVYIGFCFLKPIMFQKLKFIPLVLSGISVLLGINFVTTILVIIACFVKEEPTRQEEFVNTQNPQVSANDLREKLKLSNMAEKIALIKNLKNEGSISDEEYAKLLDEIISNGVKE